MRRLFIILLCTIGWSCHREEPFDAGLFSEELYSPRYATGFSLLSTEQGDATLLVVNKPWQGSMGEQRMLLIDPEERFGNVSHPSVQRISGSVERVVCLSSSYIAMLDAIGQVDKVVGVSGKEFIYNEKISSAEHIGDVGYDSVFNMELLLSLNPDLVLLYGISAKSIIEERLQQFHIPYIYIGEYLEPSPLGKAEWIVAIAEIVGLREQGEECFKHIEERYNTLCQRVRQHTQDKSTLPRVLLNTPYRDVWYLPAPESYMVQLIEDAGGFAYTEGEVGDTTTPIGIEQAYSYAQEADLWLNVGSCESLAELKATNPHFSSTRLVTEQRVYNNTLRRTPSSGSDFWESGVVKPDVILEDLIRIIHPTLLPTEELYYYKQLK